MDEIDRAAIGRLSREPLDIFNELLQSKEAAPKHHRITDFRPPSRSHSPYGKRVFHSEAQIFDHSEDRENQRSFRRLRLRLLADGQPQPDIPDIDWPF